MKKSAYGKVLSVLAAAALLAFLGSTASAQSTVNSTEGVSGDQDLQRRGPVLTVDQGFSGETPRLLVDAYLANDKYSKYPIRFDFYVNRRLVSSQLRANELPGPIGINIGPDIATPPFNYSVVATLLHPNRQFTTVIHGALHPSTDTVTVANCTVTLPIKVGVIEEDDQDSPHVLSAENVSLTENASRSLNSSFTATSADGEERSASVSMALNLDSTSNTASGIVTVAEDGQTIAYSVTGTVAHTEGGDNGKQISSLEVSAATQGFELTCLP